MPIVYFASKDKAVESNNPIIGPVGSMGFISWRRLIEQLGVAGELRSGEKITHMRMALDGIAFRVERQ